LELLAQIGKQQMLVLVNSRSVGTFISDQLAQTLKLLVQSCPSAQLKAADGGQLHCSEIVPTLRWWVQGHTFCTDARV
jgi:hypothetical protein